MRVLLVDDEGSLLLTLAANLELEGFEVVAANSGARALEIIAVQDFDLVLTDIRMPAMSGVELFQRIRALRPDMPVVLMTAFALEDLVDQALGEGAFTVLPKPFAIEQVTATLIQAAQRPVVLVVDGGHADDTARALSSAGVAAQPAEDEQGAMSAVRGGRVDVCVVPLVPQARVAAVIQRLVSWEPALTFLAVAPRSVPDFVERMVALRAFACLHEPVDVGALAVMVARARGARIWQSAPGRSSWS